MTTARRSRPTTGRNIELAKIHMGATQLRLIQPGDDSAYRLMLREVAGVQSAKDLDARGRAKVLAHLRATGWADTKPAAGARQGAGQRRLQGTPQSRLIRHLWSCLHRDGHVEDGSDAALRSFTERQSASYHPDKTGYSAPELLPKPVAGKVIEHLKLWCQRTGTAYE
jgi:phage gp16-like protein